MPVGGGLAGLCVNVRLSGGGQMFGSFMPQTWLLIAILAAVLAGPIGAAVVFGLWIFDILSAIFRNWLRNRRT